MRTNILSPPQHVTHEGAVAKRINAEQQLRRSVMACMLWESEFYESGVEIGERIASLVPLCKPETVHAMAVEARTTMKLRHTPLWLLVACLKYPTHWSGVTDTVSKIVRRADEPAELLAMIRKAGHKAIPHSVRRGLDMAMRGFNEHQLAKYDRAGDFKIRDVFRMVHPKPETDERSALWKRAVNGELATPDTWETSLSAGKDKKETWTRLLAENRLGGLALLRNLRNMIGVGVDDGAIRQAIVAMDTSRILPFRFIAAARYAPQFEPELEAAMFRSTSELPKLAGKTTILIDVSGSMDVALSSKSDMHRLDAACGMAMVARELCESVRVVSFSDTVVEVPPRRGFALRDAIVGSQAHSGTYLGRALSVVDNGGRIAVVTDEQSHDNVPGPKGVGYMINVASDANGVGYGKWTHIDGFSEGVFGWLAEHEKQAAEQQNEIG